MIIASYEALDMRTIEEHSTLERFPLLRVKCSDVKIYVNKTIDNNLWTESAAFKIVRGEARTPISKGRGYPWEFPYKKNRYSAFIFESHSPGLGKGDARRLTWGYKSRNLASLCSGRNASIEVSY